MLQKPFQERSRSSFIPQTKSKLLHQLKSKDNTYLVFDFNLGIFKQIDLVSLKTFSYIASTFGDFWWTGMVSEVNMDEPDVMVEFLHLHGPQKISNGPETLTDILYQCKQYFVQFQCLSQLLDACVKFLIVSLIIL